MKTILFIEDNKDILENFTEYFEIEGYKILGAMDGNEGLKLAEEFMPDLIICDVLMPVMDGREVLHMLITTAKTFEIPFIFSSSMSEAIDKSEAIRLGADDYIIKPYEPKVLLKIVKALIKSGSKRKKANFLNDITQVRRTC
jgi:DNA-binding response OmpR family regulator